MGQIRDKRQGPRTALTDVADQKVTLRILVTGDLHANLRAYDYLADTACPGIGLIGLETDIDTLRKEHDGPLLLLDAGDTLQGGLLGEIGFESDTTHPVISTMNTLGYDVAAPGNHDFEFGYPHLRKAMDASEFDWVCCNVHYAASEDTDQRAFVPWVMREWFIDGAPLRVGVLGLTLPEALAWNRPVLGQALMAQDMITAAERGASELREAGADLVVAIAHTGIGTNDRNDLGETSAVGLAKLAGIDCLALGHTHLCFPGADHPARQDVDPKCGTLFGKPAIMAGHSATHLGMMDLELTRDETWELTGHRSKCLRQSQNADVSPNLIKLTERAHEQTRAFAKQRVGFTPCDLNSHFSLLRNDAYLSCLSEAAKRGARAHGVAETETLIAAVTPYRTGGRGGPTNFTNIPSGPVSRRHISDLYPFENVFALVRTTAKTLRLWMEDSASIYSTQTPDALPRPILDPFVPPTRFDAMHGVQYDIDLTQRPFAGRIDQIYRNGVPLEDGEDVVVATSAYRCEHLLANSIIDQASIEIFSQTTIRKLLSETLADQAAMARVAQNAAHDVWTLHAPIGCRAWFDGPSQSHTTPQINGMAIDRQSQTEAGFRRFHLSFQNHALAFAQRRTYVTL